MKASSPRRNQTLRIAALTKTTIVALGHFGHVRAQSSNAAPNVVPIRPLAPLSSVPVPDVPELNDYVANKEAAMASRRLCSGTCRQAVTE